MDSSEVGLPYSPFQILVGTHSLQEVLGDHPPTNYPHLKAVDMKPCRQEIEGYVRRELTVDHNIPVSEVPGRLWPVVP